MGRKLKDIAANAALAVGSLVVTLLVLEHVVFRFVLVPDDLLENKTINQVVRYAPNQTAVFRHPDGSRTVVTVNADGWNSTWPAYPVERTAGRELIAVIGDSYVHGGFVNVDEAFPEVLERRLAASGRNTEVFRFGMDGAPLSQYLHVLRREVVTYKPDIVVVPLIHNDFDEMYRGIRTRYASSFLKLAKREDGSVEEIEPSPFEPGLADKLRAFRTFRYLYYETNLYLHMKRWISRYFWGGEEDWDPAWISAAVDIRKIKDHDANRFFARYVLAEMKQLADTHGFKLIVTMDPVREALYENRTAMDYEIGRLNRIAREVTGELKIPFVDLEPVFAADWARDHQRFEFSYDWHWNVRANRLVGDALAETIGALPVGASSSAAAAPALPRG